MGVPVRIRCRPAIFVGWITLVSQTEGAGDMGILDDGGSVHEFLLGRRCDTDAQIVNEVAWVVRE